MNRKAIHETAELLERISLSQSLQPTDELWFVDRTLKVHHQLYACLRADRSYSRNTLLLKHSEIDFEWFVLNAVSMSWDSRNRGAQLINIYYTITLSFITEKLFLGFQTLSCDSIPMLTGHDFGLPNLLLGDAMLAINFSKIVQRQLAFWKTPMQHHNPLLQSKTCPLTNYIWISKIIDFTNSWSLGVGRYGMDMFQLSASLDIRFIVARDRIGSGFQADLSDILLASADMFPDGIERVDSFFE